MITTRSGRKLKLPSTAQIKHDVLVGWLADQTVKEELESKQAAKASSPTTRTAPVGERKKAARQKTKKAAMPN
jgi:hypothetical protein